MIRRLDRRQQRVRVIAIVLVLAMVAALGLVLVASNAGR